jgi:hypothetical protein
MINSRALGIGAAATAIAAGATIAVGVSARIWAPVLAAAAVLTTTAIHAAMLAPRIDRAYIAMARAFITRDDYHTAPGPRQPARRLHSVSSAD